MKHTAVQWLVNNLPTDFQIDLIRRDMLKIALEMEKEQMKHAYHDDRPSLSYFESGEAFEEYYKEIYEAQEN